MNWFERLTAKLPTWLYTAINLNRGAALSLVVAGLVGGCAMFEQASTKSPATGQEINQTELEAEMNVVLIEYEGEVIALQKKGEVLRSKYESAFQDIKVKELKAEELRNAFMGLAGNFGNEVGLPVAGVLAIVAAGLGWDNRRKDAVIEDKKEELNRFTNGGQQGV